MVTSLTESMTLVGEFDPFLCATNLPTFLGCELQTSETKLPRNLDEIKGECMKLRKREIDTSDQNNKK